MSFLSETILEPNILLHEEQSHFPRVGIQIAAGSLHLNLLKQH